jgi:hypothetical protein
MFGRVLRKKKNSRRNASGKSVLDRYVIRRTGIPFVDRKDSKAEVDGFRSMTVRWYSLASRETTHSNGSDFSTWEMT